MPASLGKAGDTMSASVPALPHQDTSTRFIPSAVSTTMAPPTASSRTSTSNEKISGAAPSIMMPPTPTMKSSRSAVGSSTLPRSLTWWKWRAM